MQSTTLSLPVRRCVQMLSCISLKQTCLHSLQQASELGKSSARRLLGQHMQDEPLVQTQGSPFVSPSCSSFSQGRFRSNVEAVQSFICKTLQLVCAQAVVPKQDYSSKMTGVMKQNALVVGGSKGVGLAVSERLSIASWVDTTLWTSRICTYGFTVTMRMHSHDIFVHS